MSRSPCLFARAPKGALRHSRAHGAQLVLLTALGLSAAVSSARADQFTIVDASWTHDEKAKDSHHYENPSAATPKNLTSPVDYSKGSVHIVLDVKTKPPGNTPTDFQVCFEGNPAYVCTDIGPTYTKTGQVVWSTPVSKFYVGSNGQGGMGIDYSKGVSRVACILKDTHNGKPSIENTDAAVAAMYTPTDLHIEVVWVSPGATYMPPASSGHADAGVADAGAGETDAGLTQPPTGDAADSGTEDPGTPGSVLDASAPGPALHDAAASAARGDARVAVSDGGGPFNDAVEHGHDDLGCSAARGHAPTGWSLGVLSVLLLNVRRRRAQRKR